MEDSSDSESYMSESVSSYDGKVRSNRGSVTKNGKGKRGKVPRRRTYSSKKAPAYQKERFIREAGSVRANDVILGRGPSVCSHEGNILFRFLCHLARPVYVSSGHRRWKSRISNLIVKQVASLKPPGRYIESGDDGVTMYLVPEGKVLEKTCQALRESKMACPPTFRELARQLEERETKEEKAKLLASYTGVDLKTITKVQDEMDEIIASCEIPVSFMGKTPAFGLTGEVEPNEDSEGPSAKKQSHASGDAPANVPRSHGTKKAVKGRILASEKSTKRATSKSGSRKSPSKSKLAESNTSSESKSIRGKTGSKRGTKTRQKSGVTTKPVKKRPVVDANVDVKPLVPKKHLSKAPRHLSTSMPLKAPPDGTDTPEREHWMPKTFPTKFSQEAKSSEKSNENTSEPSAKVDNEAIPTPTPSLTTFLSGIISSGAIEGSGQTPQRMAPALSIQPRAFKKHEAGDASPSRTSVLPPNLTSFVSGVHGPNYQEWLTAIAQNQECLTGPNMDAASLLPPQLSSFLSGMFGDAIDFKNAASVEEALELLPPTLANRLSCTLLTPMQSSFFTTTTKKDAPSPQKGIDGAPPAGFMAPAHSTFRTAKYDRDRGETKSSAGPIVTGVCVTEWGNDSAARLDQASPATVATKKSAGALVGSAKSARSLLDDDAEDEVENEKVQAARRLSFGRDLFHHNDQPL
jgi:hypothetical protein